MQNANGFTIATSIYPIQELTQAVVGSFAKITLITPRNTEPHDYELTAKDVGAIASANLLMTVGEGSLEPWLKNASNVTKAPIIRVASYISGAKQNPHFWVNPRSILQAIDVMQKAITDTYPEKAEAIAENAQQAKKTYTAIAGRYKKTLETCKNKTIVVSHDAFALMAKEYGLKTISIAGIDPEAEPDAKSLSAIMVLMKKEGIRTIFKEPLLPPKYIQLLANQTGAMIQTLDPIEGISESQEAMTLPQSLEKNLKTLSQALQCAYNTSRI